MEVTISLSLARSSEAAVPAQGTSHTVVQRFAVNYEYPVVFTRDLFSPENPILANTLARQGGRRHKFAVLIDDGLAARERRVFDFAASLAAPVVVMMAGGYGHAIEETCAIHAQTVAIADEYARRGAFAERAVDVDEPA